MKTLQHAILESLGVTIAENKITGELDSKKNVTEARLPKLVFKKNSNNYGNSWVDVKTKGIVFGKIMDDTGYSSAEKTGLLSFNKGDTIISINVIDKHSKNWQAYSATSDADVGLGKVSLDDAIKIVQTKYSAIVNELNKSDSYYIKALKDYI